MRKTLTLAFHSTDFHLERLLYEQRARVPFILVWIYQLFLLLLSSSDVDCIHIDSNFIPRCASNATWTCCRQRYEFFQCTRWSTANTMVLYAQCVCLCNSCVLTISICWRNPIFNMQMTSHLHQCNWIFMLSHFQICIMMKTNASLTANKWARARMQLLTFRSVA